MRGRGTDRLVVAVKALQRGWSEGGGSAGFVGGQPGLLGGASERIKVTG